MIVVTGHIEVDPALVHELAADLRAGIPRTLAEEGCLFYAFAVDDAAAGTILACERWRDEATLAAHLATPEVAALFGKWGDRLSFRIKRHDGSNEQSLP